MSAIRIHLEGGSVCDIKDIPVGVTVEVWDYDVEHLLGMDGLVIELDNDGRQFDRTTYPMMRQEVLF